MNMNEHVSNDPLKRLVARFDDARVSGVPEMMIVQSGDPLEQLGAWIVAARDLSGETDEVHVDGVLGELLARIESARVLEPASDLELRVNEGGDPRSTIARWIEDERGEVGSVPSIVRLRDASNALVGHGLVGRVEKQGESGVEAAIGRAVLSMIGDRPLGTESRKKAVGLLAVAMDELSPQALQAVLRVLIAGD